MSTPKPKGFLSLPKTAKRVFKGIIFDTYQWKQKQFDGSYKTFEIVKRPSTVLAFAADKNDQLILINGTQPGRARLIEPAGGRPEDGEDPFDTAKRELLEETGYASKDWILWFSEQPIPKMDYCTYAFIARDAERIKEPELDSGENYKVELYKWDDFVNIMKDNAYEREVQVRILKALIDKKEMLKIKKLFRQL